MIVLAPTNGLEDARAMEAVLRRMPAEDRQRVLRGLEALVDAASEAARP